jgi:hypothetical protein
MIASSRTDLHYGILLRNIPSEHDTVIAELVTTKGVRVSSGPLPLPTTTAPAVRLSETEFNLLANSNIELALPERRLGWKVQAVLTQQLEKLAARRSAVRVYVRRRCVCHAQIHVINNRFVAGIVV